MPDAFPASLGFKLPLDWRAQQVRGDLPAFEGDPYRFLSYSGFRFVEFATGPCTGSEEADLVFAEARRCAAAGLGIALHPYLGGPSNPAHFGRRPESAEALQAILDAAATAAGVAGGPVTVILHPAESQYDPDCVDRAGHRADLLAQAQRYLTEVQRRLPGPGGRVQVVAEHQLPTALGEPTIRIGDTCEELLRVVAGTGIPLCWDTGHYIIGVARYAQPDPPPPEFVQRVRHVHLHDVADGVDHRVAEASSDRLCGYMQLLQRSGFTGTVTLEYALDAILDAGGFERVIREAPGLLAGWAVR